MSSGSVTILSACSMSRYAEEFESVMPCLRVWIKSLISRFDPSVGTGWRNLTGLISCVMPLSVPALPV